jgi:hypothetical protein
MATIHIIYDPDNRINGLTQEELRKLKASAIKFTISDDITMDNIDVYITQCVEMLLEQMLVTND